MPESENKSTPATAGTSFLSVLQIIFVVLKLTDNKVIGQWPWWKVMLPLIISSSLCLFLCCCGAFCICVGASFDKPKDTNDDDKQLQVFCASGVNVPVIEAQEVVVGDIESSG
jgi:hypothetical protein|tara:strand:+ start:470 stop:808 length:339 start_codon:yes stop_codon:yes gene_type:complete